MEHTTIINLTSHPVTIIDESNNCQIFGTSSHIIRMINNPTPITHLNGIPVVSTTLIPSYVPPHLPNTYYIVSTFVNMCLRRSDFISPDTSTAIRDDSNHIIATQRFQTFSAPSNLSLIELPEVTIKTD